MRVPLLLLGATLLVLAAASAQEEAPRGRERLRELVQKARSGDAEAQNLLASRRRKIVRKQEATTASAGRGPPRSSPEAATVAAILAGPGRTSIRGATQATAAAEAPPVQTRLPSFRTSRQRGESVASRPRSRSEARPEQAVVTTFRPPLFPTITTTPKEAPAPPPAEIELSPAAEEVQASDVLPEESSGPQHVDLTPTNTVPSMFQSAQFGAGGRGVQATQTITRTRPVSQSQARGRQEPHRAIQRGLETGSRSEVNLVEPAVDEGPKTPPIQTTSRYSYFDDAGNYVFGYEAEDGSFKEEIRGKDCIVNGKYGYIDPDGVRREFTYVSGNKCDPNNPDGELLIDGVAPAKNDQFLHQTQAQALSPTELSQFALNRRRQPTKNTAQQGTVPQQRAQPARTRVAQPRTRPTTASARLAPEPQQIVREPERVAPEPQRFAPEPQRFAPDPQQFSPEPVQQQRQFSREHAQQQQPEDIPVDLTPTNDIPSMFRPAQFGKGGRGVPSHLDERFPVPEFLSGSRRQEPSGRPTAPETREAPRRQEPSRGQQAQREEEFVQREEAPLREEAARRQPEPAPHAPQHVDLTPTNVIPSIFQPAQFGAGGRGVQAVQSVTRSPLSFNFEQEFQSVFSHFDGSGAPRVQPRQPQPTQRPTPRPTPPPTSRPVTRPSQLSDNSIPSLFRPAQFNDQRSAAHVPIEDNALTLSAQPQQTGTPQLVFDASTGTFKTIRVQNTNHHFSTQPQPPHQPTRPPPPPPPQPTRPPPPPPTQSTHSLSHPPQSFSQTTGRPLFAASGNPNGLNPLPPIPTSAAEFDRFFAQFPSSG